MDELDGCVAILFVLLLLGFLFGGALLLADGAYYGRKAFAAETACEVRHMQPHRKFFSTDVVCVPVNTRQDTTTVNVNTRSPEKP